MLAAVLKSLENSTLWYLGYKNIFCWLKAAPCGNVLMWSLKRVLRNAVNTYSFLSDLYLVWNTPEFCLSASGLPHCLPFGFKSGLAVFSEAEVAELEGYHQHCSLRENSPSDKSLNQYSDTRKSHPCHLIIHLQKNTFKHREKCDSSLWTTWKSGLELNPSVKKFLKKLEKVTIKEQLCRTHIHLGDFLKQIKNFYSGILHKLKGLI